MNPFRLIFLAVRRYLFLLRINPPPRPTRPHIIGIAFGGGIGLAGGLLLYRLGLCTLRDIFLLVYTGAFIGLFTVVGLRSNSIRLQKIRRAVITKKPFQNNKPNR